MKTLIVIDKSNLFKIESMPRFYFTPTTYNRDNV